MIDLREYKAAAERYRPVNIRVLFIAESPPAYTDKAKKSYFFFERNPGSDILFATVVEAIYDANYRKSDGNKEELLRQFQTDGYWLIDAVEYPINRVNGQKISESDRALEMRANTTNLFSRLDSLRRDKLLLPDAGIILIKNLVFEILAQPLSEAGYRVLHCRKIGFPRYHRDRDTIQGIRKALAAL